jgi:hypothetical protein
VSAPIRTLPRVSTTADALADVPINIFWIAGYTTPGYPQTAARRAWAQLIVTTQGSSDLTPEAATEIVTETRADAQDIVLLGPFGTAQAAAAEQRRWLAASPSPIEFYSSVRVQTLDGQPPHPLAVQYVAKALALGQPMLELDDLGPGITVVTATVSDALSAAFDAAGWVISAFGAVETPVEFRSMTIETASVYRERTGSA